MAGAIVILGCIPRTTCAGITVVHAGLTALAALAIIIIRITYLAALAVACRERLIPIPACMTGSIIIIRRTCRTTGTGVTVVHAAVIALVALAVIIIRIAFGTALAVACREPIPACMTGSIIIIGRVRRTTGTGITVVQAAVIALVAFPLVNIREAFRAALAVARGVDIVSRTATAAVIRSHRSYNRKEKKDKTGRQQEPVCCQT